MAVATWETSLTALKDNTPAAAEAAASTSLTERIAAADKEFAASIVRFLIYSDGTSLWITNKFQTGQGACPKVGAAAFTGFQTGWLSGTYKLVITAHHVKLVSRFGLIVFHGTGFAPPPLRGSWPVVF
ncbi:hypothetical protein MIND_00013700 [Mycena indigotica]|uniref:Uncharacterized protein n=1 Tax=Mycena indigotica TaxID=2126181 RepID=A0A8H6TDZ3_9AGAR|nr:uncharacterized protein MIND_00013700 [Mycena indigotica]KAF7314996.1 hypothetical protein MIND_00013700 [Mycena indigotica]